MSRRANNGGKTFVWTTRAGSYRSRTRVEKYDFVYIYIPQDSVDLEGHGAQSDSKWRKNGRRFGGCSVGVILMALDEAFCRWI